MRAADAASQAHAGWPVRAVSDILIEGREAALRCGLRRCLLSGTKLLLPKAIRMSAMTADILMFNTKAFPQKSAK